MIRGWACLSQISRENPLTRQAKRPSEFGQCRQHLVRPAGHKDRDVVGAGAEIIAQGLATSSGVPWATMDEAMSYLSEPSSLGAHPPLGAKILPVEHTIRRWRVGTGQHTPHATRG